MNILKTWKQTFNKHFILTFHNIIVSRFAALLREVEGNKDDEDSNMDMEITFVPGLSQKVESLIQVSAILYLRLHNKLLFWNCQQF